MGLLNWTRKGPGGLGIRLSRSQQSQVPCLEQLEPRVLLSAEPSFVAEFQPLEIDEEPVIFVDIGEVAGSEWLVAGKAGGVRSQESEIRSGRAEVASYQQPASNKHTGLSASQIEAAANLNLTQQNEIQSSSGDVPEESSLFHSSPFTLQTSDLSSVQIRGPPTEIVFIDSSLNLDFQLENAYPSGVMVSAFSSNSDGLQHITNTLAAYTDLSAIHIVSHGAPGQVSIGTSVLNSATLDHRADEIAAWGDSLGERGDILLYGCAVAQNDAGTEMIDWIAERTDADVTASTNATGLVELGGDWILEYRTGPIEAALPFEPAGCAVLLEAPDWLEANETRATAAAVGVAPGVHLTDMTIHDGTDEDWYSFEILRADNIDATIAFPHATGDLNLEVTDASGTVLGSGTSSDDDETVLLTGLASGTYYVRVYGNGGATNTYDLNIEPGPGSSTTVYYVNNDTTTDDYYTLAPGNDANDGLTPLTARASVQSLLSDPGFNLDANSLVVIDTGTYGGSTVSIEIGDQGAAYAGTPGGSNFSYGGTRFDLTDSDFNLIHDLSFTGSGGTGIYIHGSGGFDSNSNVVQNSTFSASSSTGVRIDGGSDNIVRNNSISGGGSAGIDINSATSISVRGNTLSGKTDGVQVDSTGTLVIENNDISASQKAIELNSATIATIQDNEIHNSDIGVHVYSVDDADVSGNVIHDNNTGSYKRGVWSYDVDTVVYGNEIYNNTYGIYGKGTLGGTSWAAGQPNDIHHNTTGVYAENGQTVQFNRIHDNVTGVTGQTTFDIHHNLIYRNTGQGIYLNADNGVNVANNTVYTPSGDGIRMVGSTQNVTLRNNIIWTEDGYGLNVATNSQNGFDSDYNNLYASGTGKLAWWQKDFTDLYDWQVEADYDNHSIGYTGLDPALDDPQFIDLANNDYHLTGLTSTSIDAGDPATVFSDEPVGGGRINLGAYGGTADAAEATSAYIRIDYPEFYTDLEADYGHVIQWHTFNIPVNHWVDIDLYKIGVGKIADIAQVDAKARII